MMKIIKNKIVEKIFGKECENIFNKKPVALQNYIQGKWLGSENYEDIPNPLTGELMYKSPFFDQKSEIEEIKKSLSKCKKSGLHNPFKNPERYRGWGDILTKTVHLLHNKEVEEHFIQLIMKVMPKSRVQAEGEFIVTRRFLENFTGDNPRLGLRGFSVAGDEEGSVSHGYRFPYGPCVIITPFNFPFEIPVLEMIGALISGNKLLIKGDSRVSIVLEHFVKLLEYCGAYTDSLDMIHCSSSVMEEILEENKEIIRNTHFTGSSQVANKLSELLDGKVRFEDSGYNWKILGPDVRNEESIDYVVSESDEDSYASGGEKCSAESLLLMHENWLKTNYLDEIKRLAMKRSLENLTISPVLTLTNKEMQDHVDELLEIPKSELLFGGSPIEEQNNIPHYYGAFQPTAIYIPFQELCNPKYEKLIQKEIFGPFEIISSFKSNQMNSIVNLMESIEHHLTAGIVSNDIHFTNFFIKNTVNGVTYVGKRAKTTGAPENHWFGPSNDPRGSGIGTIESIIQTWTCHREIIYDYGNDNGTFNKIEQS